MRISASRTIFMVAAAVAALLVVRYGISRVEMHMKVHSQLLPPAWQNRKQVLQAAAADANLIPDPGIGFSVPPNLARRVTTGDYSYIQLTDALGFPNRGEWPEHAALVFTGDSLLTGQGIGVDASFVNLIRKRMKGRTVRNLGNQGAGLERQRLIYERYGVPLNPTVVVAGVSLAWDLMNDHHWFEWKRDPLGMTYDAFRLSYADRTQPRPGFITRNINRHPLYSWAQSFVEPWLWGSHKILHRMRMSDGQEIYFDRHGIEAARTALPVDDPELLALSTSLDRFRERVNSSGGLFAVMLIPSKEELFAIDQPPPHGSPVSRIKDLLDAKHVPYLDLYPVIRGGAEHATPYFTRDIHLNRYGNQLVANSFLEWYECSLSAALQEERAPACGATH